MLAAVHLLIPSPFSNSKLPVRHSFPCISNPSMRQLVLISDPGECSSPKPSVVLPLFFHHHVIFNYWLEGAPFGSTKIVL